MAKTFDLDLLTVELGKEFQRRGMVRHLEALRAFWCRRHPRPSLSPSEWDEGMVLGWLASLRIPPFDQVYPLLPQGSACPKCGRGRTAGVSHAHVQRTWPGGWLLECADCHASWVCEGT